MSDLIQIDSDLQDETNALVVQAEGVTVIESDAQFEQAAEYVKAAVSLRKRIEEFFRPLLTAARATVKSLTEAQEREVANAVFVENRLRPAMAIYVQAAEARQKAAEAEALAKARETAEAARQLRIEAAKASGNDAAAEVIRQQPTILVVPRAAVAAPPKVAGIGTRETYAARVTDLKALVQAAAAEPERYLHYLQADQAALNAQARRLKESLRIPGVEPVKSSSTTVRT